ncbi:aminoacyl-tRNA hydrolase [Patescibacteria group bacterium]|nr:aminoacyl-tRNA hydrolase [Patescibacteria group bacterium]MBU2219533.1 aminoacyl-tRNA hydrolase [Patescibacteria group bacterium]MBU2265372.1 aminoacyl-tRNA hydrolase [Patescibacteria group bacterium]
MHLIIGLGNPGSEYSNTRHNFGFLALNYFQDSTPGFSAWQASEQFKALISEGQIDGQKILLAKPQTFMNNSGQAVKLIADFYKIPAANILVLHDDLDLALGEIRLSQNASAGGHKGISSIIEKLGTQDFARLRLGLKPQNQTFLARIFKTPAEKFVLKKFSETEKELVQQAVQKAKEAISLILKDGLTAAQNKFN